MKKALILAGAIAAFSFSQASELWWTVANPVGVSETPGGGTASVSWETAKLYASANGYNTGGNLLDTVTASEMAGYSEIITDLGAYGNSAYSFYVELFNSSGSLGKSYFAANQGAATYASLVGAGAIDVGSIMNPSASAYEFSNFTTQQVIPEPSSGLMMLLGMVALGLKRKRV